MKLKKGKFTVEVKRDEDGNLPVEYHNDIKAGWKIIKLKAKTTPTTERI